MIHPSACHTGMRDRRPAAAVLLLSRHATHHIDLIHKSHFAFLTTLSPKGDTLFKYIFFALPPLFSLLIVLELGAMFVQDTHAALFSASISGHS